VTPGISGMSGRKRVGGGVSAIAKNDCTVKLAGGANRSKENSGVGEREPGKGGCVSEIATRAFGRLVSLQIAS